MDKKKIIDAVERTTATFGQAFLGVVLVSGVSDMTAVKAAAVAGGIAAAKFAYVQLNGYLKAPEPPAPPAA